MPFYEEEVRYLEANIKTLPSRESQVVFYGSSSIRLWSDFQNCNFGLLGASFQSANKKTKIKNADLFCL